jgi:hypothetical protein
VSADRDWITDYFRELGGRGKPVKLQMPATRQQGFENFVQMIINSLLDINPREALLQSIDLLDSIRGNSNPYSSVTKAEQASESHARQLADKVAEAVEIGRKAGIAEERARLAQMLGLA